MHHTTRFNNSTNASQSEILGAMMRVKRWGWREYGIICPKTLIVKIGKQPKSRMLKYWLHGH